MKDKLKLPKLTYGDHVIVVNCKDTFMLDEATEVKAGTLIVIAQSEVAHSGDMLALSDGKNVLFRRFNDFSEEDVAKGFSLVGLALILSKQAKLRPSKQATFEKMAYRISGYEIDVLNKKTT